jgi:hypothetical protein
MNPNTTALLFILFPFASYGVGHDDVLDRWNLERSVVQKGKWMIS